MTSVDHPSKFVASEYIDRIRNTASAAEHLQRLHPDQLSTLIEQNWLNMFVPKEYGGLELSLPEGVRIEECLSWADGSTGWVVTLCSGAAWFSGFLSQVISEQVFVTDNVCFAGSGAPTGIARVSEDGYLVSGYWKYASGSLHATVFTANCVLFKEDKPLLNEDGSPVVKAFLFKKEEVTLHLTWNSMGMIATGSHDFEVKPILLDHNRCFTIDREHAVIKRTLYQFPFLQLAEVTLTANLSGMAVRFLDLTKLLFEEGNKHSRLTELQKIRLQEKISIADDLLLHSRENFYHALDTTWETCLAEKIIPPNKLREISLYSYQLADASRRCLADLYPYCGLAAAKTETEINRVWRNFHTASQHALFTSGFLDLQ